MFAPVSVAEKFHKPSYGPLLLPTPYGIIVAFFERKRPANKTQRNKKTGTDHGKDYGHIQRLGYGNDTRSFKRRTWRLNSSRKMRRKSPPHITEMWWTTEMASGWSHHGTARRSLGGKHHRMPKRPKTQPCHRAAKFGLGLAFAVRAGNCASLP